MSKLKQAAGAAICALGVTIGTFAMAGPASAAVYTADYDCGIFGDLAVELNHNPTQAKLYFLADGPSFLVGVATSVEADLLWDSPASSITNLTGSKNANQFFILSKSSVPSLAGAPDRIDIRLPDLSSTYVVHCAKV